VLWEGRKPYTLHEAAVADDGTVAGYAYSHGRRGFSADPADRTAGDVRVIILEASGNERLNQAWAREPGRTPNQAPSPLARGLFLDAANDRFVVRVAATEVNRWTESWWSYQLSSGKRLAVAQVAGENAGSWSTSVLAARPVAGTPLVLIQWWRYEYRSPHNLVGPRFTLIDPAYRTVWSLELPADYNIPEDDEAEGRLRIHILDHGAILDTLAGGRFDLWFAREARRVTFAIRKDGDSWRVEETARAPYVPAHVEAAAALPRRPARFLGKVELETPPPPAGGSTPPADGPEEAAAAGMDGAGNLYCAGRRTRAVHVFSPEGRRLRTCAPGPADFPAGSRVDHLTVDGAGNAYLALKPADPRAGSEYLHFSPRGERLGKKQPFGLEPSERWYAQPAGGNFWVVGSREVHLVDSTGKRLRELRRRPDGRWLDAVRAACVARDGSLALLIAGLNVSEAVLSLHSPAGQPLRAIPLPLESVPLDLAYDGRWAVVRAEVEVLLIDTRGGSVARLEFSEAPPAMNSRLFLRGEPEAELRVVEAQTVRRFAVP
jgi:hypothetical protein